VTVKLQRNVKIAHNLMSEAREEMLPRHSRALSAGIQKPQQHRVSMG
jgi:hypothetical protein